MNNRFRFLIVGGGTGGITAAARIKRAFPNDLIAVIEPGDFHYYQPLWTLVGAGLVTKETTRKPMSSVIPNGVIWIKDRVTELLPDENGVRISNNQLINYDYLILSPGLTVDFDKIKGVAGNLGKNGLCSIYDYEQSEKMFEQVQAFSGGTALFTFPPVPLKCAGAPQKIMYLVDEVLRKEGLREKSEIHYYSNGPAIFGIPVFADALTKVVESKQIKTHFLHRLIEVKASEKIAVFERVAAPPVPAPAGCAPQAQPMDPHVGEKVEVKYDLLHVVPPNSPPDFVSKSPLAWNEGPHKGWLQVDQFSLQHPKYTNVFGLGDVTGIPNAKTGAAIRKQAPILVENLIDVIKGRAPQRKYDGYASCPLITSSRSVILAEFGYDGKLLPSFPLDPTKERYIYWILKRYLLPIMYWWGMLKGRL